MQTEFSAIRANMIEGQLRPNKVNNTQVLAQFALVAREDFAAPVARSAAYIDQPTPVGEGREMFEARVTARLVQELDLTSASNVLVLAGGTGYTTAIVAGLAGQVTMVEQSPSLVAVAQGLLKHAGNISIQTANPATFTPRQTYQAMVVDAPFVQIPNLAVLTQHLEEGGKLVGVRIQSSGVPSAVALTKHGKSLIEDELFDTKGHALAIYAAPETFTF